MTLLLNLSAIVSGGGRRVATTILRSLVQHQGYGHTWIVLTREDASFGLDLAQDLPWVEFRSLSRQPVLRIAQLAACSFRYRHVELAWTLFGPCLPAMEAPQITGFAYSNICYPEIDFWPRRPLLKRQLLRFRDSLRLRWVAPAECILVENEEIGRRLRVILDRCRNSVVHLPPPRHAIRRQSPRPNIRQDLEAAKREFTVVMAAGWHPNKRLEMVPTILEAVLQLQPESKISFLLTLDPQDRRTTELMEDAQQRGVEERIRNVGPVTPDECWSLYESASCCLVMSRLESFTNAITEAWESGTPLAITARDWARALCGEAAAYIEPDRPRKVAESLAALELEPGLGHRLAEEGRTALQRHPNGGSYIEEVLRIGDSLIGQNLPTDSVLNE